MYDRLLASIETFYDCVGDEYDRARALMTFSHSADDSGIFMADIATNPMAFTKFDFHNNPEESVRAATSDFESPNDNMMFHLYSILPERVPTLSRVFFPDDDYYNSAMYQKASKPWGLHGEAVCILSRGADAGRLFAILRHKHQEEFDPEGLGLVSILANHLHRSMSLQRRIDKLEEALIQSCNVLDLIEFGLVLYGSNRTPLFVNAAARRLLDAGDGLRLLKSGLAIGDRNADNRYQTLIDAIYQPNLLLSQKSGGIIAVPRLSRSKPCSLMVVPMQSRSAEMESVTAAIFLFDPDAPRTTAIGLFVSSYGLTQKEAELAHFLALGGSLSEIAEQRGVTRNTVKAQLQSIFAKTETNRQSELVSLLLRSVAGINLTAG